MVFHITGSGIRQLLAFKLVKKLFRVLAQGIDQNVQAAPVGHTQNDLLGAVGASALNQLIKAGNQALSAFQAKTLDARIAGTEVFFEAFGGGEALENVLAGLGFVFRP